MTVLRIAAIAVILSFALPWASCPGYEATGFELLRGDGPTSAMPGLWIVLASAFLALAVSFSLFGSPGPRHWMGVALGAAASLLAMLFYFVQIQSGERNDVLGQAPSGSATIEPGGWLAFLAALVIGLSAGRLASRPEP